MLRAGLRRRERLVENAFVVLRDVLLGGAGQRVVVVGQPHARRQRGHGARAGRHQGGGEGVRGGGGRGEQRGCDQLLGGLQRARRDA